MENVIGKNLGESEQIESSDNESIERRVQEVESAEPVVGLKEVKEGSFYEITMTWPHDCSVQGTLSLATRPDGEKIGYLYVEGYGVNPELRGRGLGEFVMKSFVKEGMKRGATVLGGQVVNKSSLRVQAKVFGTDNLYFYDPLTDERLDVTYDELMQRDQYQIGLWVRSDLKYLNI